MVFVCRNVKIFYFCRRVSPVRPAPAESPQGRKAARVGGCSGATQVAYPLLMEKNAELAHPDNYREARVRNDLVCLSRKRRISSVGQST